MSKEKNPLIWEINSIAVPDGIPRVHVDASFKDGVGAYAYLIRSAGNVEMRCQMVPERWAHYGASGCELYGALTAVDYCISLGYSAIGLFFDYIGIYDYLVRRPRKESHLVRYNREMGDLQEYIDLYFHKVDRCDDYHKMVDLMARSAVRVALGGEEIDRYRRLVQKGSSLGAE